MGGVFVLKSGAALVHVTHNCTTPVYTQEENQKVKKYQELTGPLVGVGTFVSNEMDMDLRPYHFHVFTQNKLGGHYENDTTPDSVEYEAYFNVAEEVIRIDQPDEHWEFKN